MNQPSSKAARSIARRTLPWLLAALALASPGRALAQFAVSEIRFYDPVDNRRLNTTELKQSFFSKAACECEQDIRLEVVITQDRSNTNRFAVVAGSGTCLNTQDNSILTDTCRILKEGRIDEQNTNINITTSGDSISVKDLMVDNCAVDQELNIYVFTGQDGSWTSTFSTTFTADGTAPATPTKDGDKVPLPGEGLVEVFFKAGSDTQANIRYQILCQDATTGKPAFATPKEALYTVCVDPKSSPTDAGVDGGEESDAGAEVDAGTEVDLGSDVGVDSATPTDLGSDAREAGATDTGAGSDGSIGSIQSLHPAYVCSEELTSDGKATISGLTNEIEYRFYVLAFDRHGNPSGLLDLGTAKPRLAEDLWERYKKSGGTATGGYCSVSGGGLGGALWLALGLLTLVGLTLAFRRRRRDQGEQR